MHIKELTIAQFDSFTASNPIGSYYQTSNYALLMTEKGYEYELIGFVDELGIIKASALILIKKVGLYKYGYSPKGFIIDYFDEELLKNFTLAIKEYYRKKLVFIKINPEIAIGEINIASKLANYNQNIIIRDYLQNLGYLKLKDNLYFESLFPRFNAIINLKEYKFQNLQKNTKNKIRKAEKRGLEFFKVEREGLDILYDFIKSKKNVDNYYYKTYYNLFNKNGNADLFLVKINYQKYLLNSKELYDEELVNNSRISSELISNPSDNIITQKMISDKKLLSYKNDIEFATSCLREERNTFIAGAFLIKYQNRVNIVISGIDPKYRKFNANYFLHFNIIEYYKNDYHYLDLNGFTGDFSKSNPYKGLNDFKIGFKPKLYEFIGEFDLILNERNYNKMIIKGILANEFNQKKKN